MIYSSRLIDLAGSFLALCLVRPDFDLDTGWIGIDIVAGWVEIQNTATYFDPGRRCLPKTDASTGSMKPNSRLKTSERWSCHSIAVAAVSMSWVETPWEKLRFEHLECRGS